MKVKKISKILSLFILIILLTMVSSCGGNKYQTFPNGITLRVSEELREYMVYQENLPTLKFDYNGVNAMIENGGSACFFVQNDQYELSDKFAEHLNQYQTDDIITIAEELQKYDDKKANFGKDKLDLDEVDENGNEQRYSVEKQIVATLPDGTRISYQFRTFLSGGKRYYIFRYSSNIGISIEEPLMVVKGDDGKNKLLLLALPFNTKYEVGASINTLKSLINKDTYLDEHYSKFAYPKYLDGLTIEEKNSRIKDWYIKYCNGKEENGTFTFTYLNAKFSLEFGINDAGNSHDQAGFKLTYLKK